MVNMDKLRESAADLNQVSDAMTGVVDAINEELKKLNLGLTIWATTLGYAKIEGRWGLTVQIKGDFGVRVWPFNDAPRALRVTAIKEWPELLRLMNERAKAIAVDVELSMEDASKFLDAVRKDNNQ